jgi:hypothetical protein
VIVLSKKISVYLVQSSNNYWLAKVCWKRF